VKLKSELQAIEENEELKSKDRRSAKRKAEAIAFEATDMNADDLLKWYEEEQLKQERKQSGNSKNLSEKEKKQQKHKNDPYIAFFGQLSFETTEDDLLQHIKSQLEESYPASLTKPIQIRILTDSKTKKSRGMAFVQVEDPEFLYALLKLHQTYLKGRRINVEKSAGGKRGSETRKAKIQAYRKEQEAYFAEVVDNIIGEFRKTGEIRDDELDDGVIQMCRRHAGPVVKAAITEYVEKGGNQMDNPSAYLTFLVTKFAKEGIHDEEQTGVTKKGKGNKNDDNSKNNKKRNRNRASGDVGSGHSGHNNTNTTSDTKRPKRNDWKESSQLANEGVDMSMSDSLPSNETKDLASIFPSSQRGKGRGYMRNVRR
jgi:RNA recognition motif-containing protein